jgi:hypothetical protein
METTGAFGFSRQVLEETPGRTLAFLRGVGTDMVIRGIMAKAGYTDADHAQGWNLLHKVGGYVPVAATTAVNDEARQAIVELDAWDEQGFRRAHAAMAHLHPEQDAFVFANLVAAQGSAAVLSVGTFLDRLDVLESGVGREKTKDADRAALETLAKRGIGKAERTKLRGLVTKAQTSKEMPQPPTSDVDPRTADMVALRGWYEDWSETARAVVKRRDHLIKLGLARRKTSKKVESRPNGDMASDGAVG